MQRSRCLPREGSEHSNVNRRANSGMPYDRRGNQGVNPSLSNDVLGYVLEFVDDDRSLRNVDRCIKQTDVV
jgi:hypothetical protein